MADAAENVLGLAREWHLHENSRGSDRQWLPCHLFRDAKRICRETGSEQMEPPAKR